MDSDFQQREIDRTDQVAQDQILQVFGYTIEVSKSYLDQVPDHYIRRQTLANAERFVVPELKAWDEKISGAQDKIKALEYQIFPKFDSRPRGPCRAAEDGQDVGTLDV